MSESKAAELVADEVARSRSVVKLVVNKEQAEGVGARVWRSIGSAEMRNFDPFLMLDEFRVKRPAGFPDHPHRGFETVTYMISGKTEHEDFAGHRGVIGPGDLQWMTAGRGIVHSEMPADDEENTGLQLWVNLKSDDKMVEPAYQELLDADIPKPSLDGVTVSVIAGKALGVESSVRTRTPVTYLDFRLEAGVSVAQSIPAGWNCFAYVLTGSVQFGPPGDETSSEAHNTVFFSKSSGEDGIAAKASDGGARFVLIAGQPIGEPIEQMGPFVMNTRKEIEEAMIDYRLGRNGFERAATWESEIGKRRIV